MRKSRWALVFSFAFLLTLTLATAVGADNPSYWVEYVWEEDGQTYYYDAFDYLDTGELVFYTAEEYEEMMNSGSSALRSEKRAEAMARVQEPETAEAYFDVPDADLLAESEDGIVAEGECGENLTWVLDSEGTLTIRGEGAMKDYSYTTAPWYKNWSYIKSLVLKEGITRIGECAFYECRNLTGDLIIPEGVTSIGRNAFYGCYGMKGSLTLPDSLTEIDAYAFYGCSGLTGDLTIPEGVTAVKYYTFFNCQRFDGVLTLGSGVTSVGDSAFYNCKGFTGGLTIPDSVKSIGTRAFRYCEGFDGGLVIGDHVETVGVQAFEFCSGFKSIQIKGNSLTRIQSGAFNKCSGFEGKLEFPASVTTIEYFAFTDCTGLEGELTFPDKVNEVGYRAFDGWKDLTTATFEGKAPAKFGNYYSYNKPVSGDNVFGEPAQVYNTFAIYYYKLYSRSGWISPEWNKYRCILLEEDLPEGVLFQGKCGDDLTWTLYEEGLLEISGTGPMWDYNNSFNQAVWAEYYADEVKSLRFGDGITSIGAFAFYRCKGIEGALTIPYGVTTIGNYAFMNCSGFTGILTIPDSVTSVGDDAFSNTAFDGLILSRTLTEVGSSAFEGAVNGDENVNEPLVIPATLTSIGKKAFASNLTLRAIEVESGNPAYCAEDGVLYTIDRKTLVQVPAGKRGELNILPTVEIIAESAAEDCDLLTGSLIIPDGVTTIGSYAFANCAGLNGSLILPDGLKSIENYTFSKCGKLTGDLRIPDGVTKIGNNAFYQCSNLTGDLRIPYGVTEIGRYAFNACTGFTGSLILPASVTTIGINAFSSCRNLTGSLNIPDSVTSIGPRAFSGCSKFTGTLFIPSGITSIESSAFQSCGRLTEVVIPAGVTKISSDAFRYCSRLQAAYFAGDAPATFESGVFERCRDIFTIYYLDGKSGWVTPEWNGYPCEPVDTIPEREKAAGIVPTGTSGYTVSENGAIKGIAAGTSYDAFIAGFEKAELKLYSLTGEELGGDYGGFIGTGFKLKAFDPFGKVIDEATVIINGELNGDGSITALDRMLLARVIAEADGASDGIADMRAADFNGDGSFNALDRVLLARTLANWPGYEA
jgi:hypothetical protein